MEAVLRAVADESRRTLLETLARGPATAGELAALLPIARPGVSRHLRVLREAGLVEARQEAQRRVYSLRPAPLAEVDQWLGRYRSLWEQRLDALHTEVARGQRERKRDMTSNASSGTRILGSLRSADGAGIVRIEDRYDTDIDDLWSAITDPDRLARWFGEVDGELSQGGEFRVHIADAGERTGQVEACEAPHRLVVTTRETDESYRRGQGVPPFDAVWQITLTTDGDQTTLVIEVKGMPLDKIAFFGAGWQIHAENLAAYLAGREPDDVEARWEELVPPYQDLAANIS